MCNGPLWGGVQSGVCALVGPVFGWRGCVYASYICLLVFQARKRREEARGLSLTRILCRPAMQRLRESCFGASCPNNTPPAAVDPELDVATCAEEPRQLSDSLADAVDTTALKRRLSFCLSSTCGQDMQGGKAQARLRLDSTSRLCRASSTGIALSLTQREMSFGRQPSL